MYRVTMLNSRILVYILPMRLSAVSSWPELREGMGAPVLESILARRRRPLMPTFSECSSFEAGDCEGE
jgi:hypothetical protein